MKCKMRQTKGGPVRSVGLVLYDTFLFARRGPAQKHLENNVVREAVKVILEHDSALAEIVMIDTSVAHIKET